MKSLDAFGRPVKEFQVKTNIGGYLSVCSLLFIAVLFFTELHYALQLERKDELVIDQNQDQKYFNITFNFTLPQAPCSVLSMNLLDPKKANVMHVAHEIYKTRVSSSGRTLGRRVRQSLLNVAQTGQDLASAAEASLGVRTSHATTHLRCHSCFQSHIDEDDCCSTCDSIKEEFRKRGWSDTPDYVFGQCEDEAYAQVPAEANEGCRLEGRLHVRKVTATVHVGVSRHFKAELLRASDPADFVESIDFSHRVDGLAFGPDFPGLVHVLDGRSKSQHTPGASEHYQYDIHVIPTRYEDDTVAVTSNQYSVTEYVKVVDQRLKQDSVPIGLWLSYDFTPFEVSVKKERKGLWHFLTEACAIIGGIFAFTGMLDHFLHSMSMSAGKHGGSSRMELSQMSSMST